MAGAGERSLTLTMTELNGNEKYGNLPQRLPTSAQQARTINTGDLMLYGADCLVLFYGRFNTPYRYTRLGRIAASAGLVKALGSGSVQVAIALKPTVC